MGHRKNKAPTCMPGGRLERTLMEINQRKASLRWRRKAFKLCLLVFLCIILGIGMVTYRMEQHTLWLSQRYAFKLPERLSFDLFERFPWIR